MNFHEMTDEALALVSSDLDAMREADNYASHTFPRTFGGEDGRCYDCDVRPHSAHMFPCPR